MLPEDQILLYRFFSGDLPLFACEQWLRQSNAPALAPARACLQVDGNQRHSALKAALHPVLNSEAYLHWQLALWLDWIAREEARAGLAVARCYKLWQAGVTVLEAVIQPYRAGAAAEPFDWNAVREQVPQVKTAAQQLLEQLQAGKLKVQVPPDW